MAASLHAWAAVRSDLDAACGLLTDPTPQNLDRCSEYLASAVSGLSGSSPPIAERPGLRAAVQRVSRLLETAAGYQHQWEKILQDLTAAGYTAGGVPSALDPGGRVSLKG